MLICDPATSDVATNNVVPLSRRFTTSPLPTKPQRSLDSANDWVPVLASYKDRVAAEPAQSQGWLQLSHLLTTLQRHGEALATLIHALKHLPFSPELLLVAGDAARCCEDHRLALRYYQRLARLQPHNSQALFCIALTQESLEQTDEAQTHYEALLALDPDWIPAYHNLGTLYMRNGQARKAISLFRGLWQRLPDYRPAQLGLAMAYDYAGDQVRSLKHYTRLLHQPDGQDPNPDLLARVEELKAQALQ